VRFLTISDFLCGHQDWQFSVQISLQNEGGRPRCHLHESQCRPLAVRLVLLQFQNSLGWTVLKFETHINSSWSSAPWNTDGLSTCVWFTQRHQSLRLYSIKQRLDHHCIVNRKEFRRKPNLMHHPGHFLAGGVYHIGVPHDQESEAFPLQSRSSVHAIRL
jgi:hypothetical protein